MSYIDIPQVFEGHSTCRVVWYGHNQHVISLVGDEVGDSAFINLDRLHAGNGIELATNGESDVFSISWAKDTESPAGVLHLTLLPRQDYERILQPDDVLLLYLGADKQSGERFIAMVSIDSVSESTSVSGSGATVKTVSVQARDLGKVLMEMKTVFDAAFGGLVVQQFFQAMVNAFNTEVVAGGPSTVVQVMLAIYFSLKQNFVSVAIGQSLPDSPDGITLESARKLSKGVESEALKAFIFPGQQDTTLLSFLDIKTFVQTPMVGACATPATALQSAGNLWQLCEMYSNRVVNEFFIDTRDLEEGANAAVLRLAGIAQRYLYRFGDNGGRQLATTTELDDALTAEATPNVGLVQALNESDFSYKAVDGDSTNTTVIALVHRQLPYDTYSFYLLPSVLVYETEIFESHLSRSVHDVVNFFRVRMPGTLEGLQQDLLFGVAINRESIRRHGLRPLEAETVYPYMTVADREQADKGQALTFVPTFEYYRSLLTTWHACNERLYSGSITMRLRPDIRVGKRLTLVRTHAGHQEVLDFYVQSVQHSWSPQPGASRTTVELVRGICREDGIYVGEFQPEAHLFWNENGSALPYNPYEVVISADLLARVQPAAPTSEDVEGPVSDPSQLEDT
jgi:hypothetical protein